MTVSPASPAINTTQQPATRHGRHLDRRQGHGQRRLQPDRHRDLQPLQQLDGTGTPLFTDANVPLAGGVATSAGYTATATGTDYWVATYNGDSNNNSVTSGTAAEPVTITPASPRITTTPGGTVTIGSITISGHQVPGPDRQRLLRR